MSKAIALIPARSGSKRVKDKNILKINGHPLLAYTISLALKSKIFDRVICVTDSKEYKKIAQKYGAEVPKLRPKKYSGDKSSDIEWVMWIMRETKGIEDYEIFSILRPTNPLRKITTISKAFKLFKKKKTFDSLRAVNKCKQHPAKMWYFKNNRLLPVLKNIENNKVPLHSQQYANLPAIYAQNASLEIAWTKILKKKNPSISGKKILGFESPGEEGFDINNQEDLILLKYLIRKKIVKINL